MFLPGGPWQRFLKKKFQVQWRLGLTCGGISVDSNVDHWRLVSQQTQQMIHSFNVAKSIQSRKSSKCLNIYTFRQRYTKKVTGTLWYFLYLCNVWKSLKKASFWKNASEASKFYFQNEYIWIFTPKYYVRIYKWYFDHFLQQSRFSATFHSHLYLLNKAIINFAYEVHTYMRSWS